MRPILPVPHLRSDVELSRFEGLRRQLVTRDHDMCHSRSRPGQPYSGLRTTLSVCVSSPISQAALAKAPSLGPPLQFHVHTQRCRDTATAGGPAIHATADLVPWDGAAHGRALAAGSWGGLKQKKGMGHPFSCRDVAKEAALGLARRLVPGEEWLTGDHWRRVGGQARSGGRKALAAVLDDGEGELDAWLDSKVGRKFRKTTCLCGGGSWRGRARRLAEFQGGKGTPGNAVLRRLWVAGDAEYGKGEPDP